MWMLKLMEYILVYNQMEYSKLLKMSRIRFITA